MMSGKRSHKLRFKATPKRTAPAADNDDIEAGDGGGDRTRPDRPERNRDRDRDGDRDRNRDRHRSRSRSRSPRVSHSHRDRDRDDTRDRDTDSRSRTGRSRDDGAASSSGVHPSRRQMIDSGAGDSGASGSRYQDRDRDRNSHRDDNSYRSRDREHDRDRRRDDRTRTRDSDRSTPRDRQPDALKRSAPSTGPKVSAQPATFIIVTVNDRLGTKSQIPCLPSDTIGDFKKLVAARIGRQPHEIMLKRQGERPFKDVLSLEDYSISNGVQIDLELDTGD